MIDIGAAPGTMRIGARRERRAQTDADVEENTVSASDETAATASAKRLRRDRLGAVLAGLPDAVVGATRDERIVFANPLAGELFGWTPEELLGQPIQILWPERVRDRYSQNLRLYFATDHPLRFTDVAYGVRRDGTEFVGEMSWGVVPTSIGPVLFAIGRDVSAQRRRSRQSAAVAALGAYALRGADLGELCAQAVSALRDTLRLERVEIRRRVPSAILASWGSSEAAAALTVPIRTGDDIIATIELTAALDDVDQAFVRAIANVLGMAASRLRTEERMRHEALHDPLTGLANRTLLRDRLGHALAQREGCTAVLVIDLDGFKHVNDTHGHAAGDALLVAVGARLAGVVRPGDTIARVGGDEFVVVCQVLDGPAGLALGARLEAAIRAPLDLAGEERTLTASVGVAVAAADASTPEELLAEADAAAYRAKGGGGARVVAAAPERAAGPRATPGSGGWRASSPW